MRLLFLAFIFLVGISMISCSDSGTGSDPGNENEKGEQETPTYNLNVDITPSDAGSVSPADTTVEEGEDIVLQADPAEGYLFTEWTGDIESTDNPYTLTLDQDYNLTANFELKSYDLTTNTEGEGTVSEQVLEQKSKEYEHGTVVELTANPAEGWQFIQWTGAATGSDNPTQITVDETKEVTAVFEIKSYSLSISTEGEGEVVKNPDQQDYEYGSTVEFQANPAEGYKFVEWTGDIESTENPAQLTVDDNKEVTAVFEQEMFSLTIDTGGDGSVEKDPDQVEYSHGTEVTLTVIPDNNRIFMEWQGDLTGSANPETITMNNDKSITAVFEEKSEITNYQQIKERHDINAGSYERFITKCPDDGSIALSGGARVVGAAGSETPTTIQQSFPGRYHVGGGVVEQWVIGISNEGIEDLEVETYAVCAQPPLDHETVTEDYILEANDYDRVIQACPAEDQVPLGGGVGIVGVGNDEPSTRLQFTRPSYLGGHPVQWAVGISNEGAEDQTIRISAVCAVPPEGYEIVQKSETLNNDQFKRFYTRCPDSDKRILSGGTLIQGISSNEPETRMHYEFPGSIMDGTGGTIEQWLTGISNQSGTDYNVTSYAVCSDEK